MAINECPKSDNGSIAGTNIGTDEGKALENQKNWGQDFVCKNSDTGDFYVLNGAVAASNRATSSAGPKKQSADLKRDINNLVGEISSLQLQIEKYKKELGSSSDSQGFLSKPSTVFALEMAGLAVGFGGIVPFLEDVRHAVKLRNPQELVDRTNKNIQQQGGCAALPNAAGSAARTSKWAVAGLAAGGLLAYDAFAASSSGGGQASPAPSQPLPNYTDTMNENELQAVYDRLITQQQALVKEKVELENKITSKPGQDKSTLDKVAGNTAFKAGAVFGVFGLAVPAIRDRYLQSGFHKSVMAADKALNLRALELANLTMANGQCSVQPVTAQEPVKATVTSSEFSSLYEFSPAGEGAMCKVPTALINGTSIDVTYQPSLAGGAWYTYDTGSSTQLVNAPTYWTLTAPVSPEPAALPSVEVSETALQAFTEADFQPYLQYLGQNVSSTALSHLPQELTFLYDEPISASKAQGFWNTYTMPLETVLPQVPDLVASAYAGTVPAEDIKSDVREINKLYSDKDLSDWNINGYRWALQQYMQGLEAGFRPEVSNLVTLAGKGGVVNRYFEVREIQTSRQNTADIESNPRLSWEPKPARVVSFAEASKGYMESSTLVAYNQAHPEIAQARREKIEQRPYDLIDARIEAFNKANAALSWKITLMVVTGQAVYSMPVAAPVAAESGAWSWGQFAGAGAL